MRRLPRLVGAGSDQHASIERATPDDLMELVGDAGRSPMQFGAMLRLDPVRTVDPMDVQQVLCDRVLRVPRFRQVLRRPPLGCGRPVWVDFPGYDVREHVTVVRVRAPGDEGALLDTAVGVVTSRMSYRRPLWRIAVVTGCADGGVAVVIAIHHVIADGMRGLAMVAGLLDGIDLPEPEEFPRPIPARLSLAGDAWRTRFSAVRRTPTSLRQLPAAIAELGPQRRKEDRHSSLWHPVSGALRVRTISVPLANVLDVAHAAGGTVNDVVLTAVTGALGRLLAERGEHPDHLVVSVPVSGHRDDEGHDPGGGNRVGVMPLALPIAGAAPDRLSTIAAITRAHKTTDRGASASLTVPVIRGMASVGVLRPLMEHQRLVHTLVTNLRGPQQRVTIADAPVASIVPITNVAWNVIVSFAVLSYAGELVVSVNVDPINLPDAEHMVDRVERELASLVESG